MDGELSTGEALDLCRNYVNRWCKPLEKIEAVLAAAGEAETQIVGLTAQAARLASEVESLEASAQMLRTDCGSLQQQQAAALEAKREAEKARRDAEGAREESLKIIQAEIAEQRAAGDAALRELNATIAARTAEVARLEGRVAELSEAVKRATAALGVK